MFSFLRSFRLCCLHHHYTAKGGRLRTCLYAGACFGIVIFLFYGNGAWWKFNFFKDQVTIDLSETYFQTSSQFARNGFLVNNAKCRIPNIPVWDRNSRAKIKITSIPDCTRHQMNLTYVHKQNVIINRDELKSMGYEISDVSCCYHTIQRVTQNKDDYDTNADNNYKVSESCHPMAEVTEPRSGFIMVVCTGYFLKTWSRLNYKNFHLVARLPNDVDDSDAISGKINYWQKCISGENTGEYCKEIRANGRPPNVLLIGIDSTSRLNFRRFLTATKQTLEKELGAVEMNGYTKVHENTFPNFIPLMTSFSEDELRKICYPSRWKPQDDCPFMWKDFSKLNYLTVHLEDAPRTAIFNYMKTGFINSPVDIYLRPWMRSVYKDSWVLDCIGYKRSEEIILDYIVDLATVSEEKGIPYFLTSWMTDLTHDDTSRVQHMDSFVAKALQTLNSRGLLNNTLLFVMSDHGYRFGDVRITSSGWYEDKLPGMFIKFPSTLAGKYSDWSKSLRHNSNQLCTPFDIHATIKDVLHLAAGGNQADEHFHGKTEDFHRNGSDSRAISLFHKLPQRDCKEADIPTEFCACNSPVAYSENVTRILVGAEKFVRHINHMLPKVCEPLKLHTIMAAATMSRFNSQNLSESQKMGTSTMVDFIIGFTTTPGDFRFEGVVNLNTTSGRFSKISQILRTNKISRGTSCLDNLMGEAVGLEVFCYCKGFQYSW